MAQQGEVNQNESVKGLFTEGSPLNFPAGATVRDENFILNRDGSRERRLGLDNELNAVDSLSFDSSFIFVGNWDSVNNDGNKNYAVIFVAGYLSFYDKSVEPLSAGFVDTFQVSFGLLGYSTPEFANINGFLVVTGVSSLPSVFYEENGTIQRYTDGITVRDVWGVDDDLDVNERPSALTGNHAYNLANQGWRRSWASQIEAYVSIGKWPSNADVVTYGLSETDEDDRFKEKLYTDVPFGTTPAPKGACIMSLLTTTFNRQDHAEAYGWTSTDLDGATLGDNSAGGARAVASYAGRIFFGGFDDTSDSNNSTYPNLSSMLFFSKSVQTKEDVYKCYQEADPTTLDGEIVASDGGFVNLAGTGAIVKLVPLGRSLLVFASAGVWELYSTDQVFSATNYQVRKLTDIGCTNARSVIVAENVPMYWTKYGIYALQPDQISESYVATNITTSTIQSFYDDIPATPKLYAFGFYDKFDKKARWLYGSNQIQYDRELIFDTRLQSWYTNVYPLDDNLRIEGMVSLDTYKNVNTLPNTPDKGKMSYKYLVANDAANRLEFFEFNRGDFKDFGDVDAEAVMITGPYSGGDSVRRKSSTYLTLQLRKTETGFEEVNGEIQPINQSSCIVQTRWDWTNLAQAGKFNDPIEMYRHPRHYMPADVNDGFDDGNTVITTKSRLRGSGRAIAIKISSSPEKDLNLLGWNFQVNVNNKV